MTGPNPSGLIRPDAVEAADFLEAVFLDSETGHSFAIPALGTEITILDVNYGEAWDVGSVWAFVSTENATANFEIRVTGSSGTSVVGFVIRTQGSGTFDSWSCTRTAPPPPPLLITERTGLDIMRDFADPINDIRVTKGRIRDSTNRINLFLEVDTVKRIDALYAVGSGQGGAIQSGLLAGTVSQSASANVVGVGTTFLTDFAATNTITDFTVRYGTALNNRGLFSPVMTSSAYNINSVTSDVAMAQTGILTYSGQNYRRGGVAAGTSGVYFVLLMLNDATGQTDVGLSSATPSGIPDLPPGFTYFACLGYLVWLGGVGITGLVPSLRGLTSPLLLDRNVGASGATIVLPPDVGIYQKVVIEVSVRVSQNNADLWMRTDGGGGTVGDSAGGDYQWSQQAAPTDSAPAWVLSASTSANRIEVVTDLDASGGAQAHFTITCIGLGRPTREPLFYWDGATLGSGSQYNRRVCGSGKRNLLQSVTHIFFLPSTGSMPIEYSVWGYV